MWVDEARGDRIIAARSSTGWASSERGAPRLIAGLMHGNVVSPSCDGTDDSLDLRPHGLSRPAAGAAVGGVERRPGFQRPAACIGAARAGTHTSPARIARPPRPERGR